MKFALSHLGDLFKVLPEVMSLIVIIKNAASDGHISAEDVGAIGKALESLVEKVAGVVLSPKAA